MELRYGGLSLAEYARFCAERERLVEELWGDWAALPTPAPAALLELCRAHGVQAERLETGSFHPFIEGWENAISDDPRLLEAFSALTGTQKADNHLTLAASDGAEFCATDSERPSHLELVPASGHGSGTYRKVI